jgi:cytochrome bd-type quinol oxidase subunit 1
VGAVSVGMVGHSQAQHMFETQPMKMASAEACCCGPFPCPTGQHSRLDIGRGGPPTLDRVRLDADPACGVPILGAGTVLFSLLVSILIYGTLMVANVYLLAKFARKGATVATEAETPSDGESSAQPAPLQASISSLSSQTLDT